MTYKSVRSDVLKSITSPCVHSHEIKTEEFTMLGVKGQADFAVLTITLDIADKGNAPELKSVKLYLAQYRNCVMSYERAAGLLLEHFKSEYDPVHINVTLVFKTRGGLTSTIDTWSWSDERKSDG